MGTGKARCPGNEISDILKPSPALPPLHTLWFHRHNRGQCSFSTGPSTSLQCLLGCVQAEQSLNGYISSITLPQRTSCDLSRGCAASASTGWTWLSGGGETSKEPDEDQPQVGDPTHSQNLHSNSRSPFSGHDPFSRVPLWTIADSISLRPASSDTEPDT